MVLVDEMSVTSPAGLALSDSTGSCSGRVQVWVMPCKLQHRPSQVSTWDLTSTWERRGHLTCTELDKYHCWCVLSLHTWLPQTCASYMRALSPLHDQQTQPDARAASDGVNSQSGEAGPALEMLSLPLRECEVIPTNERLWRNPEQIHSSKMSPPGSDCPRTSCKIHHRW